MPKNYTEMKKLIIISTLFFLTSDFLFAQNNDSLANNIREKYKVIRNSLGSYDTTMVEIWHEGTEKGETIAYFNKLELKMIETLWFGESGKKIVEYYFGNGKLIFALNQDFDNNRDEKTAKGNGGNEALDQNKTVIKEDRYYFYNEKLFLWLDNDKKRIDLSSGTNSTVKQGLITHCSKIKEKLKYKIIK